MFNKYQRIKQILTKRRFSFTVGVLPIRYTIEFVVRDVYPLYNGPYRCHCEVYEYNFNIEFVYTYHHYYKGRTDIAADDVLPIKTAIEKYLYNKLFPYFGQTSFEVEIAEQYEGY